MKPIVKDILKAVIVLSAIALASGLLLGIIFPLTRLSDKELAERAMKPLPDIYPASGYEVVEFKSEKNAVDYFFKVKGEESTYIALATGSGGYNGDVQMYVVIKDNAIIKLAAGKNGETPGVSDKAFSENYYKQFYVSLEGKDSFSFSNDIDAATGATKSSTGILNAVNKTVAYYKEYMKTLNKEVGA